METDCRDQLVALVCAKCFAQKNKKRKENYGLTDELMAEKRQSAWFTFYSVNKYTTCWWRFPISLLSLAVAGFSSEIS